MTGTSKPIWTPEEHEAALDVIRAQPSLYLAELYTLLPEWVRCNRSYDAFRAHCQRSGLSHPKDRTQHFVDEREIERLGQRMDLAHVESDKKEDLFNWRDANRHITAVQQMAERANTAQHELRFGLPDAAAPIAIMGLADTHIGDWCTDYALLERITDEILSIPDLYLVLLGDLVQMAIKLRSVAEVSSNLLPPELQCAYLESWLAEIAPRVIMATWGNHEERQEQQAGVNLSRYIQGKMVPYSDGIAHVDVQVGSQVYPFALSHKFRGRSMYNRTHGQGRYMRHEGQDREITMAGDSHEPGLSMYVEGQRLRAGLNGGSIQASGYMKRHFSLKNDPAYPCMVLFPDRHLFVPFWNVDAWQAVKGKP